MTLAWLTLQDTAATKSTNALDLMVFWVCLAIFTNLHYFATVLGGLLTLALLLENGLLGRMRTAMVLSLGGLVAAAPALVMAAIQRQASLAPGRNVWVTTSATAAVSTMVHVVRDAIGNNLPVLACGIVTILFLFERMSLWRDLRGALILGATVGLFFACILTLNTFRPIVLDRYLFAAAGAVVVGLALLCVRAGTPQWAPRRFVCSHSRCRWMMCARIDFSGAAGERPRKRLPSAWRVVRPVASLPIRSCIEALTIARPVSGGRVTATMQMSFTLSMPKSAAAPLCRPRAPAPVSSGSNIRGESRTFPSIVCSQN